MSLSRFCFIFVLFCGAIFGHQEYQDLIPNGYRVENGEWGGVGHLRPEGRGERNPFGRDFEENNYDWQAICMLDSDLDEILNGEELGDPDCLWEVGMPDPGDINGITHPGFPNDAVPPITTRTCDDFEYAGTSNFSITMDIDVPTGDSWGCSVFDFDTTTDLHLIRFDPIIPTVNEYVKEILVFECKNPITVSNNTCQTVPTGCTFLYSAAWGSSSFCLPSVAGFRVEPSTQYFFQVRYDNPNAPVRDNSGIYFTYTSTLRDNDAGIVRMGVLTDQLVVPPSESDPVVITNVCPTECLSHKMPITGINLFASRYSAHHYAQRIITETAVDGENLEFISGVLYYDLNIRETTAELPFGVIGEYELITSCYYDTSSNLNDILGGETIIGTEKCENFVAYYPKIEDFNDCSTIVNERVDLSLTTGSWRDGRVTIQCGSELIDKRENALVPTCDDLAGTIAQVGSIVSSCSSCEEGTCKQDMINFVQTDCVKALGYHSVLSQCDAHGVSAADCATFDTMFVDCEGICAIGLGTLHCENVNDLLCGLDNTCQPQPDTPIASNPNVFGFPVIHAVLVVIAIIVGLGIVVLFIYCAVTNKKKTDRA